MRFTDYLRSSVMLIGSAAFALILISAGAIARDGGLFLTIFGAAWLIIATIIGLWLGHSDQVMESIRTVLSESRPEPIFPRVEPAALLLSRLWPVLTVSLIAAVVSVWFPQLAVAAAGYGLLWAIAWRRQASAVEAIEERDAVHFWIVRSPPFKPPKLVRVPAM